MFKLLTAMMLEIGLLFMFAPQTLVRAAITWGNTTYPEPPRQSDGQPGFITFNNVFTPLSASNSANLVNGNYNVGVEVTKSAFNQSGAIWSNQPLLNLNNNFHAQMALYFGNNSSNPGDGMTFSLSSVRPTSPGANGAALGVWGPEKGALLNSDKEASDPQTLKKSFSIVFDTYNNSDTLDRFVYNQGLTETKPHGEYVGYGYPGMPDMYQFQGLFTVTNLSLYQQPATGKYYGGFDMLPSNISNNQWHEFTFDWQKDNAGGGTLTYQFDAIKRSVTWTAAQISAIFGNSQLYMGFTGSTGPSGKASEAHVVAFQQIPGLVNATTNASLWQGKTQVDQSSLLNGGDQLQYHYTIDYAATSLQSWPLLNSNLTANLQKDDQFDYVDASGKVLSVGDTMPLTLTYADGHTATATGTVTSTGLSITNLPGFTSNLNRTMTITLPVVVKQQSQFDNLVRTNYTTGSVSGDNAQFDFNSLNYTIAGNPGVLQLNQVPSFHFKTSTGGDPTVSAMIKGYAGRQSPLTQPADWLAAPAQPLQVTDTRPKGSGWQLHVQLSNFTPTKGLSLTGQAQLVDKQTLLPLVTSADTILYQANTAKQSLTTTPTAYLKTPPQPTITAGHYSATATWTLQTAP
ncbi:lectin-like domain-containing protein [Lacticaseibacillus saniviri]